MHMLVSATDVIEVTETRRFVYRGGEKLLGVLMDVYQTEERIRDVFEGKTAIDIGSSTGGFTDCLLTYGIAHVTAVDVGTLQLHESLRNDSHISLYENTDIRTFESETKYDVIVADLSFISLVSVLPNVINFGKEGTVCFLLVKPQFEVGKGNTKKGIVTDTELRHKVTEELTHALRAQGLKDVEVYPCKVRGGDGNQEYFLYGSF
jgi:23S rRNA (cytidine1920-2'-O)/16S rRNA (cytidine1409-2'-O)-methyltransferase